MRAKKKYRHVHVYIMPINCLTSSFSLDILMSLLTKSLLYAKNGYVCVCMTRFFIFSYGKILDKYLSMCVTRVACSSYKCGSDDTHACFLHRKTLSFYHKFDNNIFGCGTKGAKQQHLMSKKE